MAGLLVNFNLFPWSFGNGIGDVNPGEPTEITVHRHVQNPGPIFYLCFKF